MQTNLSSSSADTAQAGYVRAQSVDKNSRSGSHTGPLSGIRVLDLTSVVMGPFATQLLVQMGAEVTKIETPEGDNMRHVGPMKNAGMGHIFLQSNQGKKSVVLNLKKPAAKAALYQLAAEHDVFISNIRPQALARLGLDYDTLRTHNPALIHVSCCGFDQEGPYAARPAYDDLIQGAVGVPWLTQQYSGSPGYAPVTLGDRVSGLHAVSAVCAALYARSQTGEGQAVVVPMFEALTQLVLGDHMAGATFEPRLENQGSKNHGQNNQGGAKQGQTGYQRLITPNRRPYQTQDGYLCVLIYNDKHWQNFFAAINEPTLAQDPRFNSHSARAANIDAVYAEVARLMRSRTSAAWQALLTQADIPNMPANSLDDLIKDPHHAATGFIQTVQHPTEGTLRHTAHPTRYSATPPAKTWPPAPQLGEHTAEVLRGLGYSQDDIAGMQAK